MCGIVAVVSRPSARTAPAVVLAISGALSTVFEPFITFYAGLL